MELQTIITILISLLTISSTLFVVILQRKTEKIKIIESQLSQNKYKAYYEVVNIFYEIFKNVKNDKRLNEKDLQSKLIDAKKNLFIYGSDKVFEKFTIWLTESTSNNDQLENMKYFLDLMLEIRKDMHHNKTFITKSDIMLNLIQDRIVHKEFEKIWR